MTRLLAAEKSPSHTCGPNSDLSDNPRPVRHLSNARKAEKAAAFALGMVVPLLLVCAVLLLLWARDMGTTANTLFA